MANAVEPGVNQQGIGQIRIGGGVGGAQLCPALLAHSGGNADQLGAVFIRPGDVPGCLVAAQAAIRFLAGI